jgi:Leucine-rich repeat (LRR) protein
LSLSFNSLKAFPEALFKLENLKRLDLSGNELSIINIPSSENCPLSHSLVELYLQDNNLADLPPELSFFVELEVLDISKNPMETIPAELANISALEKLIVSADEDSSPIRQPPLSVCRLGTASIIEYLKEVLKRKNQSKGSLKARRMQSYVKWKAVF